MALARDVNEEGRKHGTPEGRTERIEKILRTLYPDGTQVDSEPYSMLSRPEISFAGVADMLAKASGPKGTRRVILTRTVVTEATPWVEQVEPDAGERP